MTSRHTEYGSVKLLENIIAVGFIVSEAGRVNGYIEHGMHTHSHTYG